MKKIGVLLGMLFGSATFAGAQEIHFLNYSICNPTGLDDLRETNEYVQGGGHNFYLSYSVNEQRGSFSPYEFAYGTEENPIVIVIDTVDGVERKMYYKEPLGELYAGIRQENMWISKGLWSEARSRDKRPDLPYAREAFQCVIETRNNDPYHPAETAPSPINTEKKN